MDGDIALVPDIVEVCQRYGARILIDEAHSTFIYERERSWRCRALRV